MTLVSKINKFHNFFSFVQCTFSCWHCCNPGYTLPGLKKHGLIRHCNARPKRQKWSRQFSPTLSGLQSMTTDIPMRAKEACYQETNRHNIRLWTHNCPASTRQATKLTVVTSKQITEPLTNRNKADESKCSELNTLKKFVRKHCGETLQCLDTATIQAGKHPRHVSTVKAAGLSLSQSHANHTTNATIPYITDATPLLLNVSPSTGDTAKKFQPSLVTSQSCRFRQRKDSLFN